MEEYPGLTTTVEWLSSPPPSGRSGVPSRGGDATGSKTINKKYTKQNYSYKSLASEGCPDGCSTGGCVCACLCPLSLRSSEAARCFSQMTPNEHTLITSRGLTTFEFVGRRLCDDVLFRSSCLLEPTVCATRGSDWS